MPLKNFFKNTFDRDCGWIRHPNTTGVETGKNGDVSFTIDSDGSRLSPFCGKPEIAVFGDSYAFCRQVGDEETWEHYLSQKLRVGIKNFGVGNYGFDQALLRYQKTRLPDEIKTIIIAVVPETICRVHSSWKHYLEFGNIRGFKPRFYLKNNGELGLRKNPISKIEDFENIHEVIKELQKNDFFYKKKFHRYQFRFPFTVSFFRASRRNFELFKAIILASILQIFWQQEKSQKDIVFATVMRDNIYNSHLMYRDEEAQKLLKSIMCRFRKIAQSRGHRACIVILPQMGDLLSLDTAQAYRDFFGNVSKCQEIYDLSDEIGNSSLKNNYVSDRYGGHLSSEGNQKVAHSLFKILKNFD